MIKVSVLYPAGDGATFDYDYYVQTHMGIVRDRLGDALKGINVDRGVGGGAPGEPPAYIAAGHLMFDSLEDYQTSMGPHAAEIRGDVPNFTNTQPTVVVNEVLV
jgi:uncharacterized protein (TIGR02118 family)